MEQGTKSSLKKWGGLTLLIVICAVVSVELFTSIRLAEHVNTEFFGKIFDTLLAFLSL